MKQTFLILIISSTLALCGCQTLGFSENAIDEGLTSNVDATTTVRTWKASENGTPVPVEKEVANPPAFE